ncbi:M20 family metallo-hydrolase [Ferrovibrio sp.]|uniref:M20 family metallo-hydrolase n=1 Tax=Ferrovibrio sp. TaxID=1917215 RepID=UPI003D13AE13
MSTDLRINGARLCQRLEELGQIGGLPGGGNARLAFTDEDKQGRDLVSGWMRQLGLDVTIDKIGNTIGVRKGLEPGAPVMTGSHIDTVRTGGRYDGNLGVIAGLEVIERLNEAGITTRLPLAVAFFSNEEGARFHPDIMGSMVYTGQLDLDHAYEVVGIDGKVCGDELKRIGYCGPAEPGWLKPHAFVELHIEQGPILEAEGLVIGAVDGVQGISWTEVTVEGVSAHAGTTPMRLRKDAGYAAAEIAVFVRQLTRELGGGQVGTVGRMEFRPGITNVVPNRAVMTVDIRNPDEAVLQQAEARLFAFLDKIAIAEGVKISTRPLARTKPIVFASHMIDMVSEIAGDFGYKARRMTSGAGHDAQMMATLCPTGMIFVPSVNGLSHNVKEHTEPADLEAGANILLRMMQRLAA